MELKFKTADRLSHAYIITAPDMSDALSTARSIAAAAVCMRGHDVPCGVCRACRKAAENIHPDIITVSHIVDDKGREKPAISVDQIRETAADAYILPNEAERKVYIIKDADTMNPQAQNAALKLLEEPPAGVLFLLCAVNSELLLQTVRSRCAEIICSGEAAQASPENKALAEEYFRLAAEGNRAKLYKWCAAHEDMDTRSAASFVDCALDAAADMLCARTDMHDMSAMQLVYLTSLLQRCREHLKVNVGVKHIFGLLAVDTVRAGIRGKSN